MTPQQLAMFFWERATDYSAEPAIDTISAMLDTSAITVVRKRSRKKSGAAETGRWSDTKLLANAELNASGPSTCQDGGSARTAVATSRGDF